MRKSIVFIALTLVVAACSATTSSTTTTPPTSITTTSAAASSTSTSTGAPTGCTTGPTTIPADATIKQVVDLDGDGKPDTAWIATDASGVTKVGVVTAAGGGTERAWDSASPVMRSVLVVHVNDATLPLFLADDGRMVQLWAFSDCSIADVLNVQGSPYEFSLGFTDYGTGVGCATVEGVRQLVGLDVTGQSGNTVDWTSTVVTVTGLEALNGAVTTGTYTSPADDSQIELLHTVSCGDQTITKDGISAPE
jgi:hypothetical protein